MHQTSIGRFFSALLCEPCFGDVRAAAIDTATVRTCLIVDQLLWKRTINDMLYEMKNDDLTIKEHG